VRDRAADFQGSQVGSAAGEIVVDSGETDAGVDRG
jgi:hypothetical protein